MAVLVVQVGIVSMGMPQGRVPVSVRMRLDHGPVVRMLVVLVVNVDVLMF